jgi:acyl-CoA synthetase (AMP-forming)/AMP-acid ligase II
MKVPSRGALATDPLIGAGNVLQRLLDLGADPDGPGLSFDTAVEQHPAEHPLTLGQLDERVAARAAALHARGFGPRDPVAIWSATAADQILSFLAANRLGAIPALVNGNLPAATVAAYVRGLRARAVLADAERLAELRGPAGIPIGAVTPEEIALSILADIVQARRRKGRSSSRMEAAE